jgi:hypothetical protein
LSAGTEFFFALAIASNNVGLPETSAPPARAETSIALISFAKFLARLESIIAFLCLVVAHLEWPLMNSPINL